MVGGRRVRLPPPSFLVLALGLNGLGCVTAKKKKPPTALEASFKERITNRLNSSLEAALGHLTVRLGLGDAGAFGGYELELGEEGQEAKPTWRHSCLEVVSSRDSVENCAMRQLHALGALCDAGLVERSKAAADLVRGHLRQLASKKVAELGLHCTKFDGVDIWFHRKAPDGSPDDIDASPALQASLLAATVRCAEAVNEPQYFADAESWFMGLQKIYPERLWKDTNLMTFHKSSIIWESLSLVASHLPADSSFHAKLVRHVELLEGHLRESWQAASSAWSFASARALAIRHASKQQRTKRQRAVARTWAQEHVDRFLGGGRRNPLKTTEELQEGILQRIGGAGYTCGPLQGLASLASVLSGPQLLQVVLQLLEKDVDNYQLATLPDGEPPKPPAKSLNDMRTEVAGTFFRDESQMKLEMRRSLRVDDVAMCVIALTQVLKTLEETVGVVIDDGDLQQPEKAAATADEL